MSYAQQEIHTRYMEPIMCASLIFANAFEITKLIDCNKFLVHSILPPVTLATGEH